MNSTNSTNSTWPLGFLSPISPFLNNRASSSAKFAGLSISFRPLRTVSFPCPPNLRTQSVITATSSPAPEQPRGEDDGEPLDTFNLSASNLPEDFVRDNELKKLKWSEIPFADLQEEMQAIDDYQKAEDLSDDDPWPIYLRAAAYEYWGQPKLALAQYALTKHATGLRQVPEIWERRAYNAFKIGEVMAANAYFEMATVLQTEAVGNHLHFSYWFYDNFEPFLPKRNGPSPAVQLGITKYCMAKYEAGREPLVSHIAIKGSHLAHAILWLLATSCKSSQENQVHSIDLKACLRAMEDSDILEPDMNTLVDLYISVAQGNQDEQHRLYELLVQRVEADAPHINIVVHVYLALYHDAFTRNVEERDLLLEKVCSLASSSDTRDTENFLHHVAKNRITTPPDPKILDIPERIM